MAGGSKLAVYTAIGANTVVMVAKFAGAALTMSGSMFAEGIHSAADVGNQSLLAVGMRKSQRPPDEQHPFGYGREAFVWALMSAVGIFFLGCGVTVAHGVHTLLSHETHEVSDPTIAIGILIFALVVETMSLAVAVKAMWDEAKHRDLGFFDNLTSSDDVFGIAVLLEDGAAVFGVMLALGAVVLTYVTHDPRWDAYGSIVIGLLLGALALFLIRKNRTLLLGRVVRVEDSAAIRTLLESDPAIESVIAQKAVVAGVEDYRITAELDLDGRYVASKYLEDSDLDELLARITDSASLQAFLEEYGEAILQQAGAEIDRIEAKIREEIPRARHIALEPD